MTFEEWWKKEVDAWDTGVKAIAKEAWQAGWDQQQRVIDEMHLGFKDYLCPECRSANFRHKMDCGRGR